MLPFFILCFLCTWIYQKGLEERYQFRFERALNAAGIHTKALQIHGTTAFVKLDEKSTQPAKIQEEIFKIASNIFPPIHKVHIAGMQEQSPFTDISKPLHSEKINWKPKQSEDSNPIEISTTDSIFTNPILFEAESTIIPIKTLNTLRQFATKYQQTPNQSVLIEGHTNDIGAASENRTLSQQRADAVKNVLVALGLNPKQIEAVGYGESRPLCNVKTPECRTENRRVLIKIKK